VWGALKAWLANNPTLTIQGRVRQVHAVFGQRTPAQLLATAANGPSRTGNGPGSTAWVRRVQRRGAEGQRHDRRGHDQPAHHRQWGDGSRPVGVSSSTNPSRVDSTTQLESTYMAAQRAPGSDPGRASSP
jgi:hypothetical protein